MPNIFDMGILKATVPLPLPQKQSHLYAHKQTKTINELKIHVVRVISELLKLKSLKQSCLIKIIAKNIPKLTIDFICGNF